MFDNSKLPLHLKWNLLKNRLHPSICNHLKMCDWFVSLSRSVIFNNFLVSTAVGDDVMEAYVTIGKAHSSYILVLRYWSSSDLKMQFKFPKVAQHCLWNFLDLNFFASIVKDTRTESSWCFYHYFCSCG